MTRNTLKYMQIAHMTVVPLRYDADMLSDGLLVTGEHAAMSSGGHDSWERRWLWSGGRQIMHTLVLICNDLQNCGIFTPKFNVRYKFNHI